MLLKEINAVNFRMFGMLAGTTAGFSDARAVLHEDDIRITSTLWRYEQNVLLEPICGVGILFIRSEDGVIHKFLLDQMVEIFGGVDFCVLPYECRLSYRLYSRSERRVIPITTALTGNGFIPSINVRTLYAVMFQEKDENYSMRSEEHPFWEFIYLQKGNLICEIDGKSYDLHQGQMIFFAPHRTHIQRADGKGSVSFLNVTFDGEIVHSDMISNRPVYADEGCMRIVQEIIREDRDGEIYADDMIVCDLGKLLITVTRNVHADTVITHIPNRLRVSVDNPYISECIQLIHQNITARISLPDLAGQLNLSPSYLSSLFKHKVGRSISEYVRLVRLEKVKDMIAEGRYSIAQISDILGYCSPTYLSTEFKREFQMSPKEYAKSIR